MLTFPVGETSIKKLQEMLKEYADKNSDLDILYAIGKIGDIHRYCLAGAGILAKISVSRNNVRSEIRNFVSHHF